jgi:hypothetical protein
MNILVPPVIYRIDGNNDIRTSNSLIKYAEKKGYSNASVEQLEILGFKIPVIDTCYHKRKAPVSSRTCLNIQQLNLYLCTQLVKSGCTHCKKYLNQDMDSHRLTCEVD